jgi:hypothetical protein
MTTTGSQMSDYFENIIINHVLRSASSSGSSAWLTLYGGFDEEILEGQDEPRSSASYTRLSLLNKMIISGGSTTLDEDLEFWRATEQWTNDDIENFTIASGSVVQSSGSHYMYGDLNQQKPVFVRSKASVKKGNIGFTMYNGISPYLSNRIFRHYFTNTWQYIIAGSSIYVGLYYLNSSSGSVELSGSAGYSRFPYGSSASSWSVPSTGSTSNTDDIVFSYNNSEEWRVDGAAIIEDLWDLPASGSLLFLCPFASGSRGVSVGDGFKISTGNLKVYID